jgi:hypothetical protein
MPFLFRYSQQQIKIGLANALVSTNPPGSIKEVSESIGISHLPQINATHRHSAKALPFYSGG